MKIRRKGDISVAIFTALFVLIFFCGIWLVWTAQAQRGSDFPAVPAVTAPH